MIIKVCGMRDADNIRQLDEAGIADWMGFIFFEKSSRNVTALPDYMPHNCKRVGVFVNEPIDSIIRKTRDFGFDIIQLHGNESPEYCNALKASLPDGIRFIKMIQIETLADINATTEYASIVDYFLFETKCSGYGGSGRQFDWEILQQYSGTTPFLITGGITADDADKVLSFQHPMFAGIDLNSKFETAPALKDIDLLKNFIKQIIQ